MNPPTAPPQYFDADRFLHLARQVVAVGVREEVRVYKLATAEKPPSIPVLRAQLASLLAKNPEHWRQIAHCFDECVSVAVPHAVAPLPRWKRLRVRLSAALRSGWAALRPTTRTGLVLALCALALGTLLHHYWPRVDPCLANPKACCAAGHREYCDEVRPPPPPPPPPAKTVRIIEDKAAWTQRETQQQPAPPAKRTWLTLCGLSAFLLLLGLRWMLLPGRLRRLQLQSQRAAEAALAREALARGHGLRPSYRVEPLLPVARSVAEDAATLLGRLRDEGRGSDLDVLRTLTATVRAGGRFTAVHQPRAALGEVLVLIDDESRDHPWLCAYLALVEFWRRQGVRIFAYTYPEDFPHYLDPYPRSGPLRIALSDVARQHAGAALLFLSRRLSLAAFVGESTWTQELAAFPRRAWIDADPRGPDELPPARAAMLLRLAEEQIPRFPLTDRGIAAAVQHLTRIDEPTPAASLVWPPLPALDSPAEQRALRLWATAAALVPDATWDQVRALQASLPEIHEVLPAPDTRYLFRLLSWVQTQSGENPEKLLDRLYLSPDFQDRLVRELRPKDGGPNQEGSFEQRVHQILLGQLGDAPRAPEQQEGRGRLIWELKVASHQALLYPARALELLRRFVGTGVESHLAAYLRSEHSRQQDQALFAKSTWANFGTIVSRAGRVAAADLFFGATRLWLTSVAIALSCAALMALPFLLHIPKLSDALSPKVTHTVEREHPAETHVERIEKKPAPPPDDKKPPPPVVPEKPPKVPATPQRPALVWIAPGSFTMGSPESEEGHESNEKPHRVKLTQGFYLMETEVTQGQYKAVRGSNPAATEKDYAGAECRTRGVGTSLPVHCVTWFDAIRYANALSAKEGLELCYVVNSERVTWPKGVQCRGYRLPTEAEWEYAARAGKKTVYAGGNEPDEFAWYEKNSESRLHAVRTRKGNGWGIYDMSGNVWEWVWDWYTEEPGRLGGSDPVGPTSGSYRVDRGGSWANGAQIARVAYRDYGVPGNRYATLGFRVSRSFP